MEDNHPAIIPKETFEAVQREIERRGKLRGEKRRGKYTNKYHFSGKLFCHKCGSAFKRKSWGPGKYKKYVWLCRDRFDKGPKRSIVTDAETMRRGTLRQVQEIDKTNIREFDEEIFKMLIERINVLNRVQVEFVL